MKRFTETTKWHDPWFRRLSPLAKLLWLYLTDNCDCTGLIDLDMEAATFHIGAKINEKHLAELVSRTQRTIEGKVFISRFIPFQYGALSVDCPAHKPVLKLVTERNLITNGKGYQYPSDRVSLGLPNPTGKGKGIGEGKEEGECEGEGRRPKPRNKDEVVTFCSSLGLPDGSYFWNKWVGNGFQNGGKAMRDWQAVIRQWKDAGHCPSQKQRPGGTGMPQRFLSFEERKKRKGEIQERLNSQFRSHQRTGEPFTEQESKQRQQLEQEMESL